MKKEKYLVGGINFYNIRNKNELRVLKYLPEILEEYNDWMPDQLEVEDVYALALNMLPARYAQQYSIVLREPVSSDHVRRAIREAVVKVRANPKRGDL